MRGDENEARQSGEGLKLGLPEEREHFEEVDVADPEASDGTKTGQATRPSTSGLLLGWRQSVHQEGTVCGHDWEMETKRPAVIVYSRLSLPA